MFPIYSSLNIFEWMFQRPLKNDQWFVYEFTSLGLWMSHRDRSRRIGGLYLCCWLLSLRISSTSTRPLQYVWNTRIEKVEYVMIWARTTFCLIFRYISEQILMKSSVKSEKLWSGNTAKMTPVKNSTANLFAMVDPDSVHI